MKTFNIIENVATVFGLWVALAIAGSNEVTGNESLAALTLTLVCGLSIIRRQIGKNS